MYASKPFVFFVNSVIIISASHFSYNKRRSVESFCLLSRFRSMGNEKILESNPVCLNCRERTKFEVLTNIMFLWKDEVFKFITCISLVISET